MMRHHMRSLLSLLLLTLIATVLLTSQLAAQQLIVTTKDGKVYTGQQVHDSKKILVINISGQEVKLFKKDIKNIEIAKTPTEIYAEKRAKIKDDDIDARMALAYEMYDLKAYDLAKSELDSILKAKPNYSKAKRLLKIIEVRAKSVATVNKQKAAAKISESANNTAKKPSPAAPRQTTTTNHMADLITEADMSLIRLWELPADLNKTKPRVKVQKETIDKLFKDYGDSDLIPRGKKERRRFYGLTDYKQLDLIFELQARPLYKEVTVYDDPPALVYWRKTLNSSYIANYMTKYFNNTHAPGLMLFNKRPHMDLEAYTNFLILSKLDHDGMPFINRSVPEESILFQWGLPRDDAKYPAPTAKGWRPYFTGTEDPRFQKAVKWVKGLYESLPARDYDVVYTHPGLKTTTTK